jgi:arylsulfatase A-like enzyme
MAGIAIPLLLQGLLLHAPGCANAPDRLDRADVILIMLDTVRPDFLGPYAAGEEATPFLSELAAEGVVFDDVTSTASQTAPAVLSLFTGLYPNRHGVLYFARTRSFHPQAIGAQPSVERSLHLAAEHFRAHGYATGAVITNPWLAPEHGFDQGFDHYVYERPERGRELTTPYLRATRVNELARGLLSELGDAPVFLYLHYMDAHHPYEPAPEHRARFDPGPGKRVYHNGPIEEVVPEDLAHTRALYRGALRGLDEALRELSAQLEADGRLDDALVAIVSDHGEGFLEHGGLGHGWGVYEELVRAVWILWHPALREHAARIQRPVSVVDVLPTLVDLVGLPQLESIDGKTFAARILHGSQPRDRDRILFADQGEVRAARRGPHKLIRWSGPDPREAAFDLARDPREAAPVPPDAAAWADAHAAALDARPAPDPKSLPPPRVTPGTEAFLRKLGYVE